ncbi:MAG: TIGR04282 family arsenosugar biosynthesis glycosyltransferase [Bryobacteraceae bacterium]
MLPAIILFAKAPVAGRVKTRLEPRLGPVATVELHDAFVRDGLAMLLPLAGVAGIELHSDIQTDAWRGSPVTRKLQCAGDLGLKLFHALAGALAEGRPNACILGSDAPTLPQAYVRELLASSADVALGPSEDGGYYAISCRRVHPEMFLGVEWSTSRTLRQTVEAAGNCGLSVELGQSWYDVDEYSDLERLLGSPGLPAHTSAWAARVFRRD